MLLFLACLGNLLHISVSSGKPILPDFIGLSRDLQPESLQQLAASAKWHMNGQQRTCDISEAALNWLRPLQQMPDFRSQAAPASVAFIHAALRPAVLSRDGMLRISGGLRWQRLQSRSLPSQRVADFPKPKHAGLG